MTARIHRELVFASCLLLSLVTTTVSRGVPESKLRLSTAEEIGAEFSSVPCKNNERLGAVKSLFEKMGAAPADVGVEKVKGVENVVIRKAGASAEIVIVGAHYDKAASGCGAVDNWTGVVALAHLYRSLKDVPLQKTVWFVAFGEEEKGLVGSGAMAKEIKNEDATKYCAMLNLDSLGLGAPLVLDNISSPKLGQLAAEIAKKMEMPFAQVKVEMARSDSVSFIARKIPAVTLSALSNEWASVLHTDKDQASRINAQSVYLGYRLALAMTARVVEASCQAYR